MDDVYYPPVAFHFDVKILDSTTPETDASFQEVSGLDRELELESLNEGGENRFTYQLPKRGKHPNLVLKRRIVTKTSDLATWAEDTLQAFFEVPLKPRGLEIKLLDADRNPLVTWSVSNAYPVKWVTAPLNSTESKILVESFELAYASVVRTGTPPASKVPMKGPPPPPPPPRLRR